MQTKEIYTKEIIRISKFAKAISHPVRVYILKKLSEMDACCYSGDLVNELPVGRSALSQHLKELKHAGLIQGEIRAPYIKYCINRENWDKAEMLCKELFVSTHVELLEAENT